MDKFTRISDKNFDIYSTRGPGIVEVKWNSTGTTIEKILFEGNCTIEFKKAQTVMITPHEVYSFNGGLFTGIYKTEDSKWLNSMNNLHLENCIHYKLFFYDEVIDVICEKFSIISLYQ